MLAEFLRHVEARTAPPLWAAAAKRLDAEHRHLRAMVEDPAVRVYGANTLPGHRDAEPVADPDGVAEEILRSHAIASPPWHGPRAARCVGYAKLHAWSAGLSGVSPDLFRAVARLVVRDGFRPLVPRGASYSCGDVVPAAHWARSVLQALDGEGADALRPGEAMAMVNGSFVHVGLAAAMAPKLRSASALAVEAAALHHAAARANDSNLHFAATAERAWALEAVRHVRGRATGRKGGTQDPVSMRAMPQVLEAWCCAVEDFLAEVGYLLFKPSGNPLVETGRPLPLSQASFLAPTLSIRTGAVVEAALFLMWAQQGWTGHLLSGRAPGVPRDGATAAAPLGLIQLPKVMAASCERARMAFGRRTFAAGGAASHGVEDLWTHGLIALEQLDGALEALLDVLCSGLWALGRLAESFPLEGVAGSELVEACAGCEAPGGAVERVRGLLGQGRPEAAHRLFW